MNLECPQIHKRTRLVETTSSIRYEHDYSITETQFETSTETTILRNLQCSVQVNSSEQELERINEKGADWEDRNEQTSCRTLFSQNTVSLLSAQCVHSMNRDAWLASLECYECKRLQGVKKHRAYD